MACCDIVVIGASAGGIEPLIGLVRDLPAGFPGAVFVVTHVPPYSVSKLPQILGRAGQLPAAHAGNGDRIEPGRIYVAPPDRHLLVRQGWVELTRGPRENHSRPAIDPLFRSAARAYGPRVVGVVLSGALYDGSAGLLAVKGRGGIAVVQDPEDAAVDSMPRSALRHTEADYVLPAREIGAALGRLARQPERQEGDAPVVDIDEHMSRVIEQDFAEQAGDRRADELTVYTCPDCGGVMWQAEEAPPIRFRCHVGHAYAPQVLLAQKSEELESALWRCVRLLREKSTLSRQMVVRPAAGGNGTLTERIEEQAALDERHAQVIRELLEAMPNPSDQATLVIDAVERQVQAG